MPDKDNAQLVMQPRRLIPWTRCECCEDFWCNIHDQHAYDCDCPPIDEWETDPYGLQEQGPAAQPVAIQGTVIGRSEHADPQGSGADVSGAMFTLTKTDVHAVAIGLDEEQNARVDGFGTLKARMEGGGFEGTVMTPAMQVRRLLPEECEKLQGFPRGYTNIPWRNKPESPDGPRYKALGNSMAVPVMSWIGKRINEVSKL